MNVVYKKIYDKDKNQVFNLIEEVLDGLERKEFFIPYEEWEYERFFDDSYAYLHGTYVNNKLVGIAQLYCEKEMMEEYNFMLNNNEKACELGGNLVLSRFREKGITCELMKMQIEVAKNNGFNCVFSKAHPDNLASIRVITKLDLKFVDVCSIDGKYLRNIYMKKL